MTTDAKNVQIKEGDEVVLRGRVVTVDGDAIVVARAYPISRAKETEGGEDVKTPGDGFEATLIRLHAAECEVQTEKVG